jgi:hypothetical protein
MLPDIPDTKTGIHRRLMVFVKRKIDADHPILARIKSFTQHEGLAHQYEQIGFGSVAEGFQEIGVPVRIDLAEIPDLVGENLLKKLCEMADSIGRQEMQIFFKKVDDATEKAGTKIDNRGEPINADVLLRLIEMTEVDFDAHGLPKSSFVIHPEMTEVAKKIDAQIKNDPELKARADEIRRKHYEAWLARESNRKLVD